LVCLHEVDEALETLALLVDFLVLAALKEFFLDLFEKLVLVGHHGVLIVLLGVCVVAFSALIFFLDKELVYELNKRTLIVVRILLVILSTTGVVEILL
jgi:hypothetical protein